MLLIGLPADSYESANGGTPSSFSSDGRRAQYFLTTHRTIGKREFAEIFLSVFLCLWLFAARYEHLL